MLQRRFVETPAMWETGVCRVGRQGIRSHRRRFKGQPLSVPSPRSPHTDLYQSHHHVRRINLLPFTSVVSSDPGHRDNYLLASGNPPPGCAQRPNRLAFAAHVGNAHITLSTVGEFPDIFIASEVLRRPAMAGPLGGTPRLCSVAVAAAIAAAIALREIALSL